MVNKIDTVGIIGGGVAGLSAGGLLARKGFRVKLFEANDKLGGCCATTSLGGYTFNDGALYLALPGILDHVFERLGIDRPSLLPLRKIVANQTTTLPDGTMVSFGDGLEVSVKKNNADVSTLKLQAELDNMMKKWQPVLRLFADDLLLHPFSLSRLLVKGWRHLPKFRGTVASELTQFFSDEYVRAAMSGALLYAGLPPQKIPVTSMVALAALFRDGFYLPEGGMGKIPQALSQALTNNSDEIFLNSKIDRIVVRNGRVVGLEVNEQGLVEVDAVVSTVSGMLTFSSLLKPEDVPNAMRRKVRSVSLSHKALVIQLGLSNSIVVPSHLNCVLPMMDQQYQALAPDGADMKWLIYSVPTVTMPELAPRGGSIIELYPAINQDMPLDDWNEQEKERVVESAIKSLSRIHALNIAVKRVVSPKDFRDDMHLYKGAVYGLAPTADLRAYFPHASPIGGLFQAGQTTYPGYGVSSAAMSGILAAETLMRTEKM